MWQLITYTPTFYPYTNGTHSFYFLSGNLGTYYGIIRNKYQLELFNYFLHFRNYNRNNNNIYYCYIIIISNYYSIGIISIGILFNNPMEILIKIHFECFIYNMSDLFNVIFFYLLIRTKCKTHMLTLFNKAWNNLYTIKVLKRVKYDTSRRARWSILTLYRRGGGEGYLSALQRLRKLREFPFQNVHLFPLFDIMIYASVSHVTSPDERCVGRDDLSERGSRNGRDNNVWCVSVCNRALRKRVPLTCWERRACTCSDAIEKNTLERMYTIICSDEEKRKGLLSEFDQANPG